MLDTADYTPRLRALYDEKIRAAMKEEFAYKNDMQIPRLDKVVLNIGAVRRRLKTVRKPNLRKQICRRLLVNRRLSPRQRNLSRASGCVKKCQWVRKSRCAARGCMNFLTV